MFTGTTDSAIAYAQIFGAILALSVGIPAGLYWLRGRVLPPKGTHSRLISSEIFSLFATVYAFFLGFSIVTLWTNYVTTRTSVSMEASAVNTTFRQAMLLERSGPFRDALIRYAKSVVEDEWPAMDEHEALSQTTLERLSGLWDAFYALKPADKADNILYANLGISITELTRLRLVREQALSGNLYPPVWVILIFGLFAVFVGLFLTNPEQTRPQVMLECIVAFMILSCVYFIIDIDSPFSGVLKIPPRAIQDALGRILTLQATLP